MGSRITWRQPGKRGHSNALMRAVIHEIEDTAFGASLISDGDDPMVIVVVLDIGVPVGGMHQNRSIECRETIVRLHRRKHWAVSNGLRGCSGGLSAHTDPPRINWTSRLSLKTASS